LSEIKVEYKLFIKICLSLILFFLVVFYSKISLSNNFLECIEDIPISTEFEENIEECFNFDSSTGKISIAEARTRMKPSNIINYYTSILPSFGWDVNELSEKENFVILNREQDILKISIKLLENYDYVISFNFLSLIK